MIRTLSVVAVLATLAIAPAASARDVRVVVAGKDPVTLHHDLWQAAREACFAELSGSALIFELERPCAEHAVKAAEAKIAASRELAANTTPSAR